MYLVDTNVISAASPTPKKPLGDDILDWMDRHSDGLFLSVVSVAEIEAGIAKSRRRGADHRAADLTSWLETVIHLYGQRILPFDVPAARIAGALADRAFADGHRPGFADLAIAATATSRDLVLLTRNVRHFEPLGIRFVDPFDHLPS